MSAAPRWAWLNLSPAPREHDSVLPQASTGGRTARASLSCPEADQPPPGLGAKCGLPTTDNLPEWVRKGVSTEPAERPLARDARRGPTTHTTTNRGCVGRDTVPPRHAQTRLRTPGSGCQAPPGGRAALASRSCQETAHPPPGLGLAQTRPVSDADGLSCGTKCTAPTELSSTSSAHRSVTPASSAPPEAGVPDTAHVGTAPPNPSHVSKASLGAP